VIRGASGDGAAHPKAHRDAAIDQRGREAPPTTSQPRGFMMLAISAVRAWCRRTPMASSAGSERSFDVANGGHPTFPCFRPHPAF
jgi:hypothetical protein